MRRPLTCLLVVGLAGVVGCREGGGAGDADPGPPPVEWSADVQTIADANNAFALDLYGKLREEKGNLFVSPYSVHTALGMTAVGARGNTRAEMVRVLHLPADEAKALAAGDLGRYYAHPRKDYEIAVANAVWGQQGFPWRPEFLAVQEERFGAGFREADFVGNADGERRRINAWVEGQTRNRITELLKEGQVTGLTRMVLANAIYFKGQWATGFDPKKTHAVPFHLADGGRATVPMMHAEVKCGYAEADGVKVLELPYKGDELTMVVVLPRLPDGLPAVERDLTAAKLKGWVGILRDRAKLEVGLPRFRVESRFDLPPTLKSMGMVDAFSEPRADFSGMTSGGERLYVSAVAHKAFVDVNEEGTEAAAATAVVMTKMSADPAPLVIDHPFLFLIRDAKRGTILFVGRVEKP